MSTTAEIGRLADLEIDLVHQHEARRAALAEAEQAAGNAYLEGRGADAVPDVLRLQAEADAITRAGEACHARRLKAVEAALAARAGELRHQAAEKRRELSDLETRTEKHLRALAEIEGVDFAAVQPGARSETLRAEIEDLEARARAIDQAGLPMNGVVDLEGITTTDELLAAVLRFEGHTPTVAAVREWLAAVEAAAPKRRVGDAFADRPRRARLMWRNGRIDPESSYIYVADFARRTKSSGETWYDTAAGTFRAHADAAGLHG